MAEKPREYEDVRCYKCGALWQIPKVKLFGDLIECPLCHDSEVILDSEEGEEGQ